MARKMFDICKMHKFAFCGCMLGAMIFYKGWMG